MPDFGGGRRLLPLPWKSEGRLRYGGALRAFLGVSGLYRVEQYRLDLSGNDYQRIRWRDKALEGGHGDSDNGSQAERDLQQAELA